jgi:hypothetical protein
LLIRILTKIDEKSALMHAAIGQQLIQALCANCPHQSLNEVTTRTCSTVSDVGIPWMKPIQGVVMVFGTLAPRMACAERYPNDILINTVPNAKIDLIGTCGRPQIGLRSFISDQIRFGTFRTALPVLLW